MDLYTFSLALGGAGLGVMALSGASHLDHRGGHHIGARGHGPGAAHAGHAHASHSQAAHHHAGHSRGGQSHAARGPGQFFWSLASPRVLFSLALGFGATGLLARSLVTGTALLSVAVLGALAFERLLVTPVWNLAFRFTSNPALTLESSLYDEVRATSGFDSNGQGLIAVEVDGQMVQVLGTLRPEDRQAGRRVRAGDRLRIEEVDSARGRCTVSCVEA